MLPILFILILSILLTGCINKVRAVLSGRRGYRFFQPLLNVSVLMQKASVYSTSSTIITRLAAPIYLGAVTVAALCIPLGALPALVSFDGDIILFACLLAAGRIALVLGALDSGSSFQGMGSARELFFGALGEPALYLLIATLAMITGHYSFSAIFAQFDNTVVNMVVLSILVGFGIFKLALAECGRLPIDDPRTHLELTMIHEGMILDFSGIDLAYITMGSWIKLSVFAMLFANAVVPAHLSFELTALLFLASWLTFVVAIGVLESFRARNRMPKNAVYLTTISAVGLMSIIVAYLLMNGTFIN